MGVKYKIACQCGAEYGVEASQAGREITCACGKVIELPSMLKIKKLPIYGEEPESLVAEQTGKVAEKSKSEIVTSTEKKEPVQSATIRVLAGERLGVFIVGIILVLICGWFFFRTVSNPPQLLQVFGKQTMFASGDNYVRRNSTPVTETDYDFFLFHDQGVNQTFIVNDQFIDHAMSPVSAFIYFDNLKNGLDLSDNFQENYNEVKNNWRISFYAWLIGIVISFCVCVVPWFMPRRKKVVGAIRGSEWTK